MDGEDATEEGPEVQQVVRVVPHGDQRRHGVPGRVVKMRLPGWGVANLEDPRRARPGSVGARVVAWGLVVHRQVPQPEVGGEGRGRLHIICQVVPHTGSLQVSKLCNPGRNTS